MGTPTYRCRITLWMGFMALVSQKLGLAWVDYRPWLHRRLSLDPVSTPLRNYGCCHGIRQTVEHACLPFSHSGQ